MFSEISVILWCGGGASGHEANGNGYNGGTDGGDGEGSYGGSGTGEVISSYTFSTWTLTPGAGGRYVHSGSHYYGGGGGGVLIDEAGPDGIDECQGHGYGGGACNSNFGYHGLQGVILLEIETV